RQSVEGLRGGPGWPRRPALPTRGTGRPCAPPGSAAARRALRPGRSCPIRRGPPGRGPGTARRGPGRGAAGRRRGSASRGSRWARRACPAPYPGARPPAREPPQGSGFKPCKLALTSTLPPGRPRRGRRETQRRGSVTDVEVTPGSQAALREANRRRVVEALREAGTLTQAEIARTTGLSAASVSNIVRDLRTAGTVSVRGTSSNGRRARAVTLRRASGAVAADDFRNSRITAAVGDTDGRTL